MLNRTTLIAAASAAASLIGASAASADMMVGSAGNAWQPLPITINNYNETTRPFWDNLSRDAANPSVGTNANIADYLMHASFTDSVVGTVAGQSISNAGWWGAVGPTASNFDLHEHLTRADGADVITATLLLESTDNASSNIVGWYNADNPTQTHVLWAGSASRTNNATVTFEPTTNWGFYIVGSKGTYFMDTTSSSADKTSQHFAFFQADATDGAEKYFVGVEDLPNGAAPPENTGDFNDFIFTFQSTPSGGQGVPEPASLGLLGAGGLALLTRRRR